MNNAELTFSYHFLFPPSFPFSPPPCAVVKIERQTCKLSLWCLHHHDPPHHSLFPDSRVITLIHLRLFSLSSTGAGEPKQEERLSGQTGSGEKVLRQHIDALSPYLYYVPHKNSPAKAFRSSPPLTSHSSSACTQPLLRGNEKQLFPDIKCRNQDAQTAK